MHNVIGSIAFPLEVANQRVVIRTQIRPDCVFVLSEFCKFRAGFYLDHFMSCTLQLRGNLLAETDFIKKYNPAF